jgi:hypothetical protein
MVRSIKKDTRALKVDLERIIRSGENLRKSSKTFSGKAADGLKVLASVYLLCEDYVAVKDEVNKDPSVANKRRYCGHMFLEAASYLGRFIVDNYLK